jgi:hypothetical protein
VIDLSVTATTATTGTFAFATMGASGTIELQISSRRDFQFCVQPIYTGIPRVSPYVANGLNQRATYYARARTRLGDGSAEPWSNVVAFRTADGAAQVTTPAAIMIDPAIFVLPEPIITFTPGNEQAGFPAKNVARDAPVAWRSIMAGGAHTLLLELSGAPWDTIGILNTNMPEATTITVRGAATAAAAPGAAAIVNAAAFRASVDVPGRDGYHGLVRLAAPVAHKFVHVTITGTTPQNMLHAEHLVIGLNRKSKNHALDKTETPVHLGSLERTRSGNPDRQEGYKMRRVDFELAMLTEAQYETIYGDLIRKLDSPVFVAPNSKPGPFLHDRLLYGDLRGGRVVQPASPRHTRSFTVESLI